MFNPYWQIMENSTKYFKKFSVFQTVNNGDGFLENSSIFSKFQFSGHEPDGFHPKIEDKKFTRLGHSPDMDEFSRNRFELPPGKKYLNESSRICQ